MINVSCYYIEMISCVINLVAFSGLKSSEWGLTLVETRDCLKKKRNKNNQKNYPGDWF
jgi:hypothetical protein